MIRSEMPAISVSPLALTPTLATSLPIRHQDGGAADSAGTQAAQGFIGVRHPEGLCFGSHRDGRGKAQEGLGIGSGQICHGTNTSFSPKPSVRKRRDVTHVN